MEKVTVKRLRERLQDLEEQGHGDLPCIYSSDTEGNSYHTVFYSAGLMAVEDTKSHYLDIVHQFSDLETEEEAGFKPNCVCIN